MLLIALPCSRFLCCSINMVVIDNTKFACERCIKGHRTSSCKHTDRPLIEIKKKGRPQTQCDHCRTLRKTKSVHVKCLCAPTKAGSSTPVLSNATHNPESPQTFSPSTSLGPNCAQGPECPCCVPRKRPAAKRAKPAGALACASPPSMPYLVARSQSSSDSGHESEGTSAVDLHVPSQYLHRQAGERHTHSFSPYRRAYDARNSLPPIAGLLNPERSEPALVPHEIQRPHNPSAFDGVFSASSLYDPLPQTTKGFIPVSPLNNATMDTNAFPFPSYLPPPSSFPSYFDDVDTWVQQLPPFGTETSMANGESLYDPFSTGTDTTWMASTTLPALSPSWMTVPMLIPTET